MDDLDAVRAALDYERVDLYGISYGATAAQIYLLRHANRVRRVVLDGGTLVSIPILERWAPNGQRVLDRLFARCARDARCHAAFPSPAADLARVRSRVRKAPIRVGGTTITQERLGDALQQLTVSPETAAYVPFFLRLAAQGRFAELMRRGADLPGVGPSDQSLMAQTIMCSEPWARMRRSEVARLGRGTYLLEAMLASARYREAACGVLPRGVVPPGSSTGPRSRAPVLAIVGDEDPQDPLANLAGIRRRLPNTTSVVVAGGGHGSAGIGCVPRLMNRFLLVRSARGPTPAAPRGHRCARSCCADVSS
jgi:pimeloyl-ACP methyl ester carboxylesterase